MSQKWPKVIENPPKCRIYNLANIWIFAPKTAYKKWLKGKKICWFRVFKYLKFRAKNDQNCDEQYFEIAQRCRSSCLKIVLSRLAKYTYHQKVMLILNKSTKQITLKNEFLSLNVKHKSGQKFNRNIFRAASTLKKWGFICIFFLPWFSW